MKTKISKRNTLIAIGFIFLAAPSLTQVFDKGIKKNAAPQSKIETPNTKRTLITLNNYPSFEMSAGSERATLRNPFSPESIDLSNLTSPSIIVRGFGSDQFQKTTFLSVNKALDHEYTLGQQVGNGYRISKISPSEGEIEISNGKQRIRHREQEL